MEEPKYKLEVFEGPLDLLLSLIAKNKIDITDIPIALILDQYLEYIDRANEMNMELAGEFIVMAAELMVIKTKMLLPKPSPETEEDEEDPRAKLARALMEYKLAKEAASYLGGQYRLYSGRVAKAPEMFDRRAETPEHIDYDLLQNAFERMLERNRRIPELMQRSEQAIGNLISKKAVPVSDMIYKAIRMLYESELEFDRMFLECESRSAIVAMFSALLELLKSQRITMRLSDDGETVIFKLNRKHGRDMTEEELESIQADENDDY